MRRNAAHGDGLACLVPPPSTHPEQHFRRSRLQVFLAFHTGVRQQLLHVRLSLSFVFLG
jgi:hypothetical protein